ncbi:hypothetical protein [Candidatus Nitronereus thalassa]|uniref:Lipoprotein n=1 Tax=Candidatus Nitronereus thalassa TaxID=3020898 RepID=A0ABU3K353_9BACT|nr:hypothetical protein [Candidatus Nitronereus thalassa]MDT7040827.1 hypothetical protein [Candidatus Nitronereus thalassa]
MKQISSMILVALAMVIISTTAWACVETLQTEYTGSGIQTLRPFTIEDNWEIQWEADDNLSINIMGADGKLANIAGGSKTGSSYHPKGGKFYLEMQGYKNWKVKVIQLQ